MSIAISIIKISTEIVKDINKYIRIRYGSILNNDM